MTDAVEYRARAPLRISFAGGGTDVPPFDENEGGAVLSATIDQYAYSSLRPRTDGKISIRSLDFDLTVHLDTSAPIEFDGELDLVKAAISRICKSGSGGFDLLLESGAPPGSGLGSSSTVMVTLVGILAAYEGLNLTPYEVARLAHDMERHDLGILGGKQDHYAASFGGFNFIEFMKDDVLVNPLRVSPHTINELQHNLVIAFTGITRESSQIIQDQTARVTDGASASLEGLRTQKRLATEMKSTLLKGNLSNFGQLLGEAWEQKKRLSPKISNANIEKTYELAMENGAIGGKVTGAGGGGWILFYCDPWRRRDVIDALRGAGLTVREVAFSTEGLQAWRVHK